MKKRPLKEISTARGRVQARFNADLEVMEEIAELHGKISRRAQVGLTVEKLVLAALEAVKTGKLPREIIEIRQKLGLKTAAVPDDLLGQALKATAKLAEIQTTQAEQLTNQLQQQAKLLEVVEELAKRRR